MNHEVARAIEKNIDYNNDFERDLATQLATLNINDTLHITTWIKFTNMYNDADRKNSRQEIRYRHQLRKRLLVHFKTGPKAIKRALEVKPVKPLTALKRDKPGPCGEAAGTFACEPNEVDSIARRAWRTIYDGNVANCNALIAISASNTRPTFTRNRRSNWNRLMANGLKLRALPHDTVHPVWTILPHKTLSTCQTTLSSGLPLS